MVVGGASRGTSQGPARRAVALSVVVPAYNEMHRLPATIALLARELEEAFGPCWELIVADDGGELVGCFQLTYIPGLGRHGAERCLIESVRVRSDRRGRGLGGTMMRWAIDRAREHGCALVQLTTDKQRADAHRFYRDLGFVASHEGMKLAL